MKLVLDERPRPFDVVSRWLLRAGVAALFIFVGWTKFNDHSQWVTIFRQIGFGQWFRYFTGIVQVAGGLLVLVPRTFTIGIILISCTMAGAMAAWLFLLGEPINALIPAALLGGLLFVGGEELIDIVSRSNRNSSR